MPLFEHLAQSNRLLAILPTEPRTFLLEQCELVDLQRQDVLTKAGQFADHAYFPIDSFVGDLLGLKRACDVQIGLTGSEGMVNISLILGLKIALTTTVVQGTGRAFMIRNSVLQELLLSHPLVREILHQYIAFRMDQLARNMACVNCHVLQQRLTRWLLMVRDRSQSNKLFLTHEVLALMLGVRRESVTQAAKSLQKHGLIIYSRGELTLLDELRMDETVCSCYETDLATYKRVMGAPAFEYRRRIIFK